LTLKAALNLVRHFRTLPVRQVLVPLGNPEPANKLTEPGVMVVGN
jgi:hypothetical protein